jgi:glutamyl-tRNA reductase
MLSRVSANNPDKKLLLMDMAIPRDVESDHDAFPNFQICDLEDIKSFVKNQQKKREQAIPEAEEIIDRKLAEFMYWLNLIRREGIYNGDYNKLEKIRQEEMGPLINRLPPELQNEFNKAVRKFTGRIFHLLSSKQFTNDKSGTNDA